MKRWRYKTLHFELKKDGILGNHFLDEAEVERTLCRHGQNGWELVTVLDVQGGLLALCKQPFPEENHAESAATAVSVSAPAEEAVSSVATEPRAESISRLSGITHRGIADTKADTLVKPANKPIAVKAPVIDSPELERPSSLFGDPDDEDEAELKGPSIDSGGDEEGSTLSDIKIE